MRFLSASSLPSASVMSLSSRSILLARRAMMTPSPLWFLTSSIHFWTLLKEGRLVTSQTMMATEVSRIQLGMSALNLSWPAVSHSCRRIVLSSRKMFWEMKSMPMVGRYHNRMPTCSLPSKMSQMKRFMIEDLPTAWSPRNTILYLSRGGIVPFDKFKLLMFVIPINYKEIVSSQTIYHTIHHRTPSDQIAIIRSGIIGNLKALFNIFYSPLSHQHNKVCSPHFTIVAYPCFQIQNVIMQLRLSNAQPSGPFNNAIPHHIRRQKQPIFTYQSKETPNNIYYEKNPYLLRINPSEPRGGRPLFSKSRNENLSREPSDHSSHRSLKVIRVNGLRQAQKPKLIRMQDQYSTHSSRAHDHNRKPVQRQSELEAQNKRLRQQNEALKQKLKASEQVHQKQLQTLNQKYNQVVQSYMSLEKKVQKSEEEWRVYLKSLQQNSI